MKRKNTLTYYFFQSSIFVCMSCVVPMFLMFFKGSDTVGLALVYLYDKFYIKYRSIIVTKVL